MGRMTGIELEYTSDTGRNIMFNNLDLLYVNWLKEKIVSLEKQFNKVDEQDTPYVVCPQCGSDCFKINCGICGEQSTEG